MSDQEREALIAALVDYRVFGLPCAELGPGEHDFIAVADLAAALAVREEAVTVWTCMSCGVIGDAQSCGDCGHEAMPGRWLEADGVERQLKDAWQQRDDARTILIGFEALAAREDTERPDGEITEALQRESDENFGDLQDALTLLEACLPHVPQPTVIHDRDGNDRTNYSLGRLRGRLDATLRKHGRLTEGDSQ
jgi:hypothetical protein